MINRTEARESIANLVSNIEPVRTGETLSIKPGEKFNVYNIPVDYLVPNIKNDRLAWRIREYEASTDRPLSNEIAEDIEYVYRLILDENKNENKKTIADLAKKGQEEFGVITKDGIIIDGNRRATLLRELYKGKAADFHRSNEDFKCFQAIVLSDDIKENDISALETMIQIGKDEKVPYNRINLYIKVDNLFSQGYNYKQIANYMNLKKDKDAEDMHELYKFMVDYLDTIGKPNHFTLLDGLEDQCIKTKAMSDKLRSKVYEAKWDYTDDDIDEYLEVCFDYMRSKYEGKEYRETLLGKVQAGKTNGVFVDKNIWNNFRDRHRNIIESAEKQGRLNNEGDWAVIKSSLQGNLKSTERDIVDVLSDRSITDLLNTIDKKIENLEGLIAEVEDISEEDICILKKLSKRLYELWKEFE